MKTIELYRSINQIDEDLIEGAMNINKTKKIIPFQRYIALAACFCVLLIASWVYNNQFLTRIYMNEVPGEIMQSMDADFVENELLIKVLSKNEILDYYDEFTISERLLSNYSLVENEKHVFLIGDDDRIYDDATEFVYENGDQVLEINLSKIGLTYGDIFEGGSEKKYSRISGKKLILGTYMDYRMEEEVVEVQKYVAEFKVDNIYVKITGEGMEEDEFIKVIEQMLERE